MKKGLFLILPLMLLVGCSSGVDVVASSGSSQESPTKHVVTLTLNNYTDYLDVDYVCVVNNVYSYNFDGALSFGIYDECIVGYTCKESGMSGAADKSEEAKLNKGGYGTTGGCYGLKIASFKGTVTYWM